VGGTWTRTPGGMVTAGAPRERFALELAGRVRNRLEPRQYGNAMGDGRVPAAGAALRWVFERAPGRARGRGVDSVCEKKEFSWIWTEIPKEV
jgi:hypothetical protein